MCQVSELRFVWFLDSKIGWLLKSIGSFEIFKVRYIEAGQSERLIKRIEWASYSPLLYIVA